MNAIPLPGSELKDWGKLLWYRPDENLRAKAHINNGPHLVIVPAEILACSSKPDEPRNAAANHQIRTSRG
jgi:hypothetical protein